MNTLSDTFGVDLREFYERNFARFDAKLEQRLAEVKRDLVEWILLLLWVPIAFVLIGESVGVIALLLRR